jgi:hypothetical protein
VGASQAQAQAQAQLFFVVAMSQFDWPITTKKKKK